VLCQLYSSLRVGGGLSEDGDGVELGSLASTASPTGSDYSDSLPGDSSRPASPVAAAAPALAERKKLFFSVTGMTCAACSGTIERALSRVRGVHSAKISLLTERCEVVFDERVLTPKDIVGEIEDVGFDAKLSATASKGKISLLTSECMGADKRAVITRAVLEQTGVLGVTIAARAAPPHFDVLEVRCTLHRASAATSPASSVGCMG
jgi:copper chaperone CopZ